MDLDDYILPINDDEAPEAPEDGGGEDEAGDNRPGELFGDLINSLRENAHATVFLPAGGGNWAPIHRYPDCDTFLYADMTTGGGVVGLEETLRRIPEQAGMALELEEVHRPFHNITEFSRYAEANASSVIRALWGDQYYPAGRLEGLRQRRCFVARYRRDPEGDTIRLVFLQVEGFAAYLSLYFSGGIAPRVLVPLPNGLHHQFTVGLNGHLGYLLGNDHAAHVNSLLELPRAVCADIQEEGWGDWSRSIRRFETCTLFRT